MNSLMNKEGAKHESGFTLLELLIVIAIIAILAIALVFMLNPAETLKKARDAQRISDLKTIKTALGVMLTATSTPSLDGKFGATTGGICITTGSGADNAAAAKIAYSATGVTSISSTGAGSDSGYLATATSTFTGGVSTVTVANAGKVDGNGWIPVNLKALISGTPISSFPVDPTNTVSASAVSTDLVYRYACQNGSTTSKPSYVFEIDAQLESNAYTVDDNKKANDGGDNANYFETGNSLNLLPTGVGF